MTMCERLLDQSTWVPLDPRWADIKMIADKREEVSRHYATGRHFSREYKNGHLPGACGEMTFSLLTGVPMDLIPRPLGDGGIDFTINGHTIDTKANTLWNYKRYCLQYAGQHRDAKRKNPVADLFILVLVDIPGKRGIYAGYATRDEMLAAPQEDLAGFGCSPTIWGDDLHLEMPPQILVPTESPKSVVPHLELPVGQVCDRCRGTTYKDVLIHEGRSVRRDCANCGRFIDFPVWYGRVIEPNTNAARRA